MLFPIANMRVRDYCWPVRAPQGGRDVRKVHTLFVGRHNCRSVDPSGSAAARSILTRSVEVDLAAARADARRERVSGGRVGPSVVTNEHEESVRRRGGPCWY